MQQDNGNNKYKANRLLTAVFILFTAATILRYLFRDSFVAALLAFTAEAALIGGIADWFAVTALFRKPLGISWHTAIIPSNRDKIIEKVSELVNNELLSIESISSKLESLSLTDAVADGLLGSLDKALIENKFEGLFGDKAGKFDNAGLAASINDFISNGLKKEGISNEIRSLLLKAFEEGKHKEWLSGLVSKAIEIAKKDTTREKIYKVLRDQERYNESNTGAGSFFIKRLLSMSRKSKHSNLINIAALLQNELIEILTELSKPSSPVFIKLADNAASLLEHLDEDQTLLDLLQTWKNGILERLGLLEALQQLLTSAIESENRRQEAALWIADNIDNYRNRLKTDEAIKKSTEDMLKNMLQKVIVSEHHLIGEIARETLGAFSNEKLIDFINEKVGNDLQWIRINGSIVGAVAGIAIYLFTHMLFNPYLLPLIQELPWLPH
jgi:uncharacterized membrane-anchored protein YjiN (DUF445 family)